MTFTIILTFTPQEQYSAPPPPPAPAAGTAVAKPKPKPARDLRSPKLSLDKILQDLEGSEDASYSAAFSTMAGDQAQLTPDNPALRTFLEQYSGVTDAFAIDCSNFVMLLRLNPLNEAEALESFLRLSGGGDQITAEDCRTGLFQVIQSIGASKQLVTQLFQRPHQRTHHRRCYGLSWSSSLHGAVDRIEQNRCKDLSLGLARQGDLRAAAGDLWSSQGTEKQRGLLNEFSRRDQHFTEEYQKNKPLCFSAKTYQRTHPKKMSLGHKERLFPRGGVAWVQLGVGQERSEWGVNMRPVVKSSGVGWWDSAIP
eukprot:s147_g24.t2